MKVTCITGNYPDGQKVCSAKLEYPAPIDAFSIPQDCFEVENRTVVGFSVCSSSVILDLDPNDEAAPLIPAPKRMGPPPSDRKPEGPPPGPPVNMPPTIRRAPALRVRQKAEFRFAVRALNSYGVKGAPVFSDWRRAGA